MYMYMYYTTQNIVTDLHVCTCTTHKQLKAHNFLLHNIFSYSVHTCTCVHVAQTTTYIHVHVCILHVLHVQCTCTYIF